MVKSNYAATAAKLERPAFMFALAFAYAHRAVVFAFICECVDHGGHTHPPNSVHSERILPVETKISPKYVRLFYWKKL